jgi:hypothetical protein
MKHQYISLNQYIEKYLYVKSNFFKTLYYITYRGGACPSGETSWTVKERTLADAKCIEHKNHERR